MGAMIKPLIMVVEDNLAMLDGLRDLLEIAEYRVSTASGGEEALELLNTVKPDLIISDIMMPGMDGYLFHSLVRERPDLLTVPFIFLTARGEKADIRRGKELGVDEYITKPFDEEDLLIAIRSKLARWRGLRQVQEDQLADLKQKLLVTMSHEFRTPLSYIINYSEMLDQEKGQINSDDFSQFLRGIQTGASRLHTLVEDFIKLVEIDTGEAERTYLRRRQPIADTSAWLRVVGRTHILSAESRGLEIVLDVPDGLPELVADEGYLADAIGRLMQNAIKFSQPNSKWVRLSARATGETLRISIQDQGTGIKESELASLFNVFHQIDRAKQEQQGTGSGLAICQGIVAMHDGVVHVESEYGVGSTFTIELPSQPPESR
jgi:two-component system sensor histidine kinase/response regulator